jgi:hypothetical protein
MDPKKPAALFLAMTAVVGCSLNRPADLRPASLLARVGGGGQLIEPKRCLLTVAIVSRPMRDDVVDRAVWRTADEQVVPPDTRRAWQVNGLRIGLVTGGLPPEVDAALKAPPPRKVDPAQYVLDDGQHSLVTLGPQTTETSLLLNLQGRPFGKDFKDATGFLRMTASYDGPTGVALRFVPEIHHGPMRHTFGAVNNAGGLAPQQFTVKDGQQEETFRELAASLTLQPNQVAVIGGLTERPRSLGSYLFAQPEPNSDRILQKVVLVWAKQGQSTKAEKTPAPPGLVPAEPPKQ